MNKLIIKDRFHSSGAGSPAEAAGPAMLVETSGTGTFTLQGSSNPSDGWIDLAVVPAGESLTVGVRHGFVRIVASGTGMAYVTSCSQGLETGAGSGSGSASLTNAELRATPVPVALPAGLATEATLAVGAVSRWDQVALVSSDEATAGTVYLLYRPSKAGTGLLWGLKRVITAGASTEIRYAGPANNPAVTDPWASRTTLVYGLPQEA